MHFETQEQGNKMKAQRIKSDAISTLLTELVIL